MNIADRAVVLAGECAEEYEASSPRDVDVGQVEIADGRAALDEREQGDRRARRGEAEVADGVIVADRGTGAEPAVAVEQSGERRSRSVPGEAGRAEAAAQCVGATENSN